MSTRGYVGFYKDEKDLGGYNHCDSYPEGLGNSVLSFLKGKTIDDLNNLFSSKKENNDSNEDVWDWDKGCFNNNFSNCPSFLSDSLFCEWAYIINLDDEVFEVYRGFNKNPNAPGRYASKQCDSEKYYGVELIETFSLNDCFEGKIKVDKDKFEVK